MQLSDLDLRALDEHLEGCFEAHQTLRGIGGNVSMSRPAMGHQMRISLKDWGLRKDIIFLTLDWDSRTPGIVVDVKQRPGTSTGAPENGHPEADSSAKSWRA